MKFLFKPAAALAPGFLLLVSTVSATTVGQHGSGAPKTATPIKHLVVIFQENVSFDHYFATAVTNRHSTQKRPFTSFDCVDGLSFG